MSNPEVRTALLRCGCLDLNGCSSVQSRLMWPWKRQGTDQARLAELEQGFGKLQADVRAALREVSELSERAYKFLKRAEQRARRELDAPVANQDPPALGRAETPLPESPSSPRPWGARGRRMAAAMARRANGLDAPGPTDGPA